jgi:hypothetical protein
MTSLSQGRKRISAFSYCNGKTTLPGTGESGKARPFPSVNLSAGIKVDSGAGFRRQWEVAAFLGRGFLEDFWKRIRENAMSGEGIGAEDALAVLALPREDLWRLLDVTDGVRRRFKGDAIRLCSIVNAKSGFCSEDCSFCSQSRRSKADIRKYPLIEEEEMIRAAREAKARGAREFSIVSSGLAMRSRGELERVGNAIGRIRAEVGIETCVSLGNLSAEDVTYLLSRGLRSVHHNLETSRSFFPSMCTTHDYEEDVRAVRAAKASGAWVCCGGIFGACRGLDPGQLPQPDPGDAARGKRGARPLRLPQDHRDDAACPSRPGDHRLRRPRGESAGPAKPHLRRGGDRDDGGELPDDGRTTGGG